MFRLLSCLCGVPPQKKPQQRIQKQQEIGAIRGHQPPRPSRNDSLIESRALAAYFYALNAEGPTIVRPALSPYNEAIQNSFGKLLPRDGGG